MVGNDTKHSQSITNSVVLISGLSRPRISTKRVVVQTQGTGSLVTGHSHLSDAFGRPTRQLSSFSLIPTRIEQRPDRQPDILHFASH
ncbi:hypothetical protein AFLA_010242 [Aspergillus flavus NRRL3357]|nr:hypothetical protein AFLA_010242 [Aspergillus flavus NRRL3357]